MPEKTICMVVCCYKIENEFLESFLTMNKDAFSENNVNVKIVSDIDRTIFETETIKTLKYPKEQSVFNFSKTINFGIRNSLSFDIIVKTDIDMMISSQLIKHTMDVVNEKTGLVAFCSKCSGVERAKTLSKMWPDGCKILHTGYGGYFAMDKNSWMSTNGYNENLFGWGSEDRDMFNRSNKHVSMISFSQLPLFHINHKNRKSKFFPYRSGENRSVIMNSNYKNDNWGIPL